MTKREPLDDERLAWIADQIWGAASGTQTRDIPSVQQAMIQALISTETPVRALEQLAETDRVAFDFWLLSMLYIEPPHRIAAGLFQYLDATDSELRTRYGRSSATVKRARDVAAQLQNILLELRTKRESS